MHKTEAAKLFSVLSDESRVKICKMLYHNESLNNEDLLNMIGCDQEILNSHIKLLMENNLIDGINGTYVLNKSLVDELMSFITTPCGCCKK